MAFSADEVRVLRRVLAQALYPAAPDRLPVTTATGELWAEDVQDALRLTESIDEAVQEGGRLRAFMLTDLARYRAALPGSAAGYLDRLEEAVTDGYLPTAEDLSALRSLSRQPCGPPEQARRSRLAGRCHALAEAEVRERLSLGSGQRHLAAVPSPAPEPQPATPVGGRFPMSDQQQPPHPADRPRPRRMPTPAELFGRRTRTAPHQDPPADEDRPELATGTDG
ncbi:hypothetical protein [Kitasatospora cineracea]|uniref:Uncharacterized protein n=1 Tax=Kitasatospora cineracea TaxID=88074 RepID=A0A8G1XFD9_9ACTN|nr:hypothetical protein EDD39_1901 [Kitasatospora cineracea]